ncbi:MAG: pyridoxal phosphate-dependent class II aminotransferase [Desulfamplus sp.]|nr:pyridoxal phosphate-dependent class II aminotransferase [Desulfamplus sp.]
MITGHGGNVQVLAQQHRCSIDEITDMSSNINPLGPPDGLEQFISANIHLIRSLPQPDAMDMVEAFSRYYKVPADRVIGGNGTTWFIYTLPAALKSKKVLIVGPTYADYRDGCIMNNVPFEFCMSDKEHMFQPDINKISEMAKNSDTVIICNPNNPTGSLIPLNSIIELLQRHPETYFVIDESYLPFLPDAEEISLVSQRSFPNLIVLSSMSKIFRIPGLRTGYLCADPAIIEKFMRYYQPWSVNALSQAAIIHILENSEEIAPFLDMTRSFVQEEKKIFENALNGFNDPYNCAISSHSSHSSHSSYGCSGLKLYPAHTYFILAELTGNIKSHELCRRLGDHKILIRDCENFHGLSDRFVRFSLRDRHSNMTLVSILKNIVGGN